MFSYRIISTEAIADHSNMLRPGATLYDGIAHPDQWLYDPENDELFDTQESAADAAYETMDGLDGGKAFNDALKTAIVEVYTVEDK